MCGAASWVRVCPSGVPAVVGVVACARCPAPAAVPHAALKPGCGIAEALPAPSWCLQFPLADAEYLPGRISSLMAEGRGRAGLTSSALLWPVLRVFCILEPCFAISLAGAW